MAGTRKRIKKKYFAVFALVVLLALIAWFLSQVNIPVLEPAGQVGYSERRLIIFALLLAVIVVVPTFSLTIFIIWKYREGNHTAKHYMPDWDHSRLFESLWWGIPAIIITILSVVTWRSSHSLDPYKVLAAGSQPLTIQVVALDWKWLFIYPEQNIASVNLIEVPVGTPVDFKITSDTVMNSFWVPQLGGQIYAMPGMVTQLHLVAGKLGTFNGVSANISGSGFANMNFKVRSVSENDFNNWVAGAINSEKNLDQAAYNQLAKPTSGYPVTYYSNITNNLFDNQVSKYMMPIGGSASDAQSMPNTQRMYMP